MAPPPLITAPTASQQVRLLQSAISATTQRCLGKPDGHNPHLHLPSWTALLSMGHFLHPSPATSQPQQASLLWPGHSITITSCFRGPWRHSPHLHLSEQEKVSEDLRGTAPTCNGWRKSPKIQSAGKTTVARPLLHQPQQQQTPLTGTGSYCNNWRKN